LDTLGHHHHHLRLSAARLARGSLFHVLPSNTPLVAAAAVAVVAATVVGSSVAAAFVAALERLRCLAESVAAATQHASLGLDV
jgi:hypothetical protein